MNGKIFFRCLGWLFYSLVLSGCAAETAVGGTPDSLSPKSAIAGEIALNWWIMAGLGTLVFLAVVGLTGYAIMRRRSIVDRLPSEDDEGLLLVDRDAPDDRRWIWLGGVIIPVIILSIVYFSTIRTHMALVHRSPQPVMVIEVLGRQWFWEVRYPDENIATANEIHIPVGQPVRIHLTSPDVIHSFWVPELHGKMDMIPGKVNTITLQADRPGIYRGICAEFCGAQHAKMQFLVIAQTEADFARWVEREQQPAVSPETERLRAGQQVFLGSSCVYCHTVRGTNATANIGPDLTHLASRMTIAAGVLQNNPGNLAAWVIDPQHIKPGNLMPPSSMTGEELQLMIEYLLSLE